MWISSTSWIARRKYWLSARPGQAPAVLQLPVIHRMTAPYSQVGDSLEEFLVSATSDAKLRQLMMSMSEAIRTIAFKVCWTPPALAEGCTSSNCAALPEPARS
jgi:hypothetical protein